MKRTLARYPKALAIVLFSAVLIALTAAAALSPQGDKGFVIEGKKLVIKKGFVHERQSDGTVTVRRFGAVTASGATQCKCTDPKTKGCVVTKGEDTSDGGKVEYCGGKSCCDWR